MYNRQHHTGLPGAENQWQPQLQQPTVGQIYQVLFPSEKLYRIQNWSPHRVAHNHTLQNVQHYVFRTQLCQQVVFNTQDTPHHSILIHSSLCNPTYPGLDLPHTLAQLG